MKSIDLSVGQLEAVAKLTNGCILCGEVGSGKSRTALVYYFMRVCKGKLTINGKGSLSKMAAPKDLYIITTAKKRDTYEWENECSPFLLSVKREESISNVKVTVDSWNNIKKYTDVEDAFFIFDEQRVVGYGPWAKSFFKIAKKNQWILLSATPGDRWEDYMSVFIANGYYKHKSDFQSQHCIFDHHFTFPKVKGYMNEKKLEAIRKKILVEIEYSKRTVQHHEYIECDYMKSDYRTVMRDRWNVYDNLPIAQPSQVCYLLRRVCNSDPSRLVQCEMIIEKHPRVIIFYNFDYELEALIDLCKRMGIPYAQWNGHEHEEIPSESEWAYLVQYSAGCEGWNCILTDTMIFFSQNYSYKTIYQAAGRIDRRNTPFTDLYYYHLITRSPIDRAIRSSVLHKKIFNESAFVKH